jgi:hypothetical protein
MGANQISRVGMNYQSATCLVLVLYGDLLIALGLVGVWLSPSDAAISLRLGSTSGMLVIIWGVLGARGRRCHLFLALAGVAVAALCFLWQSSLGWLAVWEGKPGNLLEAILLTLILAGSILMLAAMFKTVKAANKVKAGMPRTTFQIQQT